MLGKSSNGYNPAMLRKKPSRMKRIALVLLVLLAGWSVKAQEKSENDALRLEVDATTFFRDAEYFMPFTKGYTISGFRLTPVLHYLMPSDKFFAKAGVMLTGVAGTEGLWKVEPVLTLRYVPSSRFVIQMGTLDGSDQHYLDAPMYDPERYFIDYKEDGLQLMWAGDHWMSDTWVNWETFLEPWTADQERFTLGSNNILLFSLGRHELQIPLVFMGSHRGGQFTALDTCIETLFNEQVGLDLQLVKKEGYDGSFAFSAFFFQNQSPEPHTMFNKGWGVYPRAKVGLSSPEGRRSGSVTLGYWYGDRYQSARGSWLYQSVSWHKADFSQPVRRMITGSVTFVQMGKSSTRSSAATSASWNLSLSADAYYDLDLKKTDFAIGLIMNFKCRQSLLQ